MSYTLPSCTANDCRHRQADPALPKQKPCAAPHAMRMRYSGPLHAQVVVVGQAPKDMDTRQGALFCGADGHLLRNMLAEAGWDPQEVLYVTAVQCAGPHNASPKKTQIDLCREGVWEVLGRARRTLIICMGNEAWSCLWECPPKGVSGGAGSFRQHKFGMTLWTLAPAAVVRQDELAPQLARDLRTGFVYATEGTVPGLPPLDWMLVHPDVFDPTVDAQLMGHLLSLTPGPDDAVVIDTETTGKSPYTDALLGVGVYLPKHKKAFYFALNHGDRATSVWTAEAEWTIRDLLRRWLTPPSLRIIQNVHFDVTFIYQALGIDILPVAFDTLVEANLVDENAPKGLKERAMRHLDAPAWDHLWHDAKGHTISDYAEAAGLHLGMVPIEELSKYCAYDCYYTAGLHEFYQEKMTKAQRGLEVQFMRPQMNQLLRMARRGAEVDVEGIRVLGEALDKAIAEASVEINRMAGTTDYVAVTGKPPGLNLASVPQKQYLFFSRLGLQDIIPPGNREFLTDSGGISTSAKVVDYLLASPAVRDSAKDILRAVRRWGKLSDMRSDFVKGILSKVRPGNTVHPQFTQHVTVTGRLSCKTPNLQQVAKPLRPFFVAPEGYSFVDADYSEIEVRCWAEVSRDPVLTKVLSDEPDFHRFTVGMALGKPADEVTADERGRGKVLTFGGTMYRGGAPVIAKSMKISMSRAEDLFKQMQKLYARGSQWMDEQIAGCQKNGRVISPLGRIRRLPDINSMVQHIRVEAERQSVNSVIQGLASDLTGLSALRVERKWQELGIDAWVAILVHDSIVAIVRDDQIEQAAAVMVEQMCMTPYAGWTVPLRAKTSISKRWNGDLDIAAILASTGDQEDEDAG